MCLDLVILIPKSMLEVPYFASNDPNKIIVCEEECSNTHRSQIAWKHKMEWKQDLRYNRVTMELYPSHDGIIFLKENIKRGHKKMF